MRRRVAVSLVLVAVVDVLAVFGPGRNVAASPARLRAGHGAPVVAASYDGDLRDLPSVPAQTETHREPGEPPAKVVFAPPAPAVPAAAPRMPAPAANFPGIDASNGAGVPPDPVGDVDGTYYVQAVNTTFAVFDKATGAAVVPPTTFNALWAGSGTLCEGRNRGDPTVVYDPMGARWIVADFGWVAFRGGPYFECIAVSKTSDPVTGGWWLYAVQTADDTHPWFVDYPKMGIWPDGLYMSANLWQLGPPTDVFKEARLWAFDRGSLESGGPLQYVVVDLDSLPGPEEYFTLLPATVRGQLPAQLPPAGRTELFVGESATAARLNVFALHPDYGGSGTALAGPFNVSEGPYTLDNPSPLVPSPGQTLDPLQDQLMMQAQYHRSGGSESLWVDHTVQTAAGGPWAVHWLQVDVTGGTVAPDPVQQQVYGDVGGDGVHRWLGSLAVDRVGNMAVGYSASSAILNPQLRYSGRLAGDPPGTLPQGEATLFAGTGSETGTLHRWGDYSSMTLAPDGCTFWYTNEYYVSSTTNWQTRIGSFLFPSCLTPTAAYLLSFSAWRGVLRWRTGSEARIAGFDLVRGRVRLNRALIPARRSGSARGASYRVVDRSWRAGGRYRLEIVRLDGTRTTVPLRG